MKKTFEKNTFGKRLSGMLAVDFQRMFTMRNFYILLGTAFAIPVLVLVMTSSFGGGESAGMFTSVWQAIGSVSGGGMVMDITSMCNMNMMFFLAAVLVCLFVTGDFTSGYCKNLFAVRAKKSDYVISKSIVCLTAAALLLLGYFVGAVLGGAIAGLPFTMSGFTVANLVMSVLAKMALMGAFVGIYLMTSVIAKEKTWLAMVLSFGVGMFMFNIIPMVTPLDATVLHVVLCIAGGVMLCAGTGAVSNFVLKKTDLI